MNDKESWLIFLEQYFQVLTKKNFLDSKLNNPLKPQYNQIKSVFLNRQSND